jgi:hypothetical protein
MYRSIMHGRPVVNGYSGSSPPHYGTLLADLQAHCFESLDALRRGRSLDVVIWLRDPGTAGFDAAAAAQWPNAVRDEAAELVVLRVPTGCLRDGTDVEERVD